MKKRYLVIFSICVLALLSSASLAILVNSLGGWRYIAFKLTHTTGATATTTARAEIFECLPTTPESIVFIGDSLFAQAEWHELLQNKSVQNRAISGSTIQGISNRLDSIICNKPRKIFFMAGINDLLLTSSGDETVNRFIACLDRIRRESPTTEVYVHTLLPVNNGISKYWIDNSTIELVNERIRAYCKNQSLECIDIHQAFHDADNNLSDRFTYDGLHINGIGYLKWKDVLSRYI